MSTLAADISEAISKNLPAAVGLELRKRLEQADDDRTELVGARKALVELREAAAIHNARDAHATKIIEREAALVEGEARLKLREALCELREKHASERVSELRGVLGDVFANGRFKYREDGYAPVVVPYSSNGYQATVTSAPVGRTVEGQS